MSELSSFSISDEGLHLMMRCSFDHTVSVFGVNLLMSLRCTALAVR